MLRCSAHPTLCPFDARKQQKLLESPRHLGAELSASATVTDVNRVLGNVLNALAKGRIPERIAVNLARIGERKLPPKEA